MIFSRPAPAFVSTFALLAASLLSASLTAQAATITGTVSNRTTNKVAVHDAVVLIGFGQGMQEVARTTTDEHGRYTLQAPDAGTHLVRVDHQKATYFQPAPPGASTVDIDVYDVAEKVKGIHTEADVLTMQTDQGGLHVVENYFVKNDSQPATTQLSRRAYEMYLPSDAKIDSTAAMGPGGMPVASSPLPVTDPSGKPDPGHYAFIFPIRPGETRFQVSYHLAYTGTLAFAQRVALPTENLVVILPKAMQFTPKGSEFQPVPDSVSAQTFVRKAVSPAQAVAFTVAGSGVMPREAQGSDQGQAGAGAGQAAAGKGQVAAGQAGPGQGGPTAAQPDATGTDTRPGGGLGPPIDTPDPLHKYKAWILSALALALVVGAAVLLRKPRVQPAADLPRPPATPPLPPAAPSPPDLSLADLSLADLPPAAQPALANPARAAGAQALATPHPGAATGTALAGNSLLAALKDALFALETERLGGHTSEEEYRQLKASLEVVLRQALERETARR